jgi:YHS domain-containing protein
MTAARRHAKPNLAVALGMVAAALSGWASHAMAGERVVVDWRSGLAIAGFDPVAYFTNATPGAGRSALEYTFDGAVWRFRNEGNRAAFAANPDVYMPRFGGYDPVAVARGVAAPGHPQLWLLTGQRLYLFHSKEARDTFSADPERLIQAAERKWPEVLRRLVP